MAVGRRDGRGPRTSSRRRGRGARNDNKMHRVMVKPTMTLDGIECVGASGTDYHTIPWRNR